MLLLQLCLWPRHHGAAFAVLTVIQVTLMLSCRRHSLIPNLFPLILSIVVTPTMLGHHLTLSASVTPRT